jgi:hypothetical protein
MAGGGLISWKYTTLERSLKISTMRLTYRISAFLCIIVGTVCLPTTPLSDYLVQRQDLVDTSLITRFDQSITLSEKVKTHAIPCAPNQMSPPSLLLNRSKLLMPHWLNFVKLFVKHSIFCLRNFSRAQSPKLRCRRALKLLLFDLFPCIV